MVSSAAPRQRRQVRDELAIASMKGALLAAIVLVAPAARAAEVGGVPVDLGVAVGLLSKATIEIAYYEDFAADETFELTSPATLLLGAFFDVAVHPRLSVGGRINTASIEIEKDLDLGYFAFDDKVHILEKGSVRVVELMLSAKGRLDVAERVRLVPALYVGYVKAFADDPDARSRGFGLNGALEAQYRPGKGSLFLFGEVALMTQLYGGVTDVGYVRTKSPVLSLSVGAGI